MTRKFNSAIHPPSVTFEDIKDLCKIDPTVYACMGYYFKGEISREKALITCIIALSATKAELQERLIKEWESKPGSWAWPIGQEIIERLTRTSDGSRPQVGTGR